MLVYKGERDSVSSKVHFTRGHAHKRSQIEMSVVYPLQDEANTQRFVAVLAVDILSTLPLFSETVDETHLVKIQ